MALHIRPFQPADSAGVQQATELAFATARLIYRPNPPAFANLANISGTLERLVAEDSGQIVGTVRYGVFERSLRVIGLAVLPSWQRRGVARLLIEALAEIAEERGCEALSLYTVVQTGNVLIFERLGFRTISESPDAYSISVTGEPLTEALMERQVKQ